MKKVISAALALLMALSCFAALAFADEGAQLKFDENGKFTVVHLTDVQDTFPMNKTTHAYIEEMLAEIKPDLVVLGGDNTVCDADAKADAIKEMCDLFVNAETYFTLVFGNHDHQQGVDKETLLGYYQQFGGKYCLAYDAAPELFGVGTHNLTVMSADGSKPAYNIYMMDSNTYYPEEGNDIGYDAVHEDEINWYKATSQELKAQNGGKVVPAIMFQHIIVQEIYDKLFYKSPISVGGIGEDFEGVGRDGVEHFIYIPKIANMESGFLFEKPCPGYYNYGQLDALKEVGDVKAIFSGHDHTNDFTVNIDGVDVINSAGCTYHSYGNDLNRGCRVITLDEDGSYETYTYTVAEQALKEGSTLTTYGDITAASAKLAIFGKKFLAAFMEVLKVLFFIFK